MHDLRKLANTIIQILDREPRDHKLTEQELHTLVKEYTGDNMMSLNNVRDAVSFLEIQKAVLVDRFMGKFPPAFDWVKISRLGRMSFQLNRDWPISKEQVGERPVQEVHINKVDGDVQISQSGDNVIVKSEVAYEVTFQELKDQIRSETMLSDEGKEAIIEQIEILEEEEEKETPDKGRAQRAYDWVKAKAPPFVKDVVINLIANLIAQGIVA